MNTKYIINEKIKSKRVELEKKLKDVNYMCEEEILNLSKELDELILQFIKNNNN